MYTPSIPFEPIHLELEVTITDFHDVLQLSTPTEHTLWLPRQLVSDKTQIVEEPSADAGRPFPIGEECTDFTPMYVLPRPPTPIPSATSPLYPSRSENPNKYNTWNVDNEEIFELPNFAASASATNLQSLSRISGNDYGPSVDESRNTDLLRTHAEHRYRNKISEKFDTLQNSVPSLRVTKRRLDALYPTKEGYKLLDDSCVDYSEEDLGGLIPARKLNKGVILEKAIEYIRFLELKTKQLQALNDELIAGEMNPVAI